MRPWYTSPNTVQKLITELRKREQTGACIRHPAQMALIIQALEAWLHQPSREQIVRAVHGAVPPDGLDISLILMTNELYHLFWPREQIDLGEITEGERARRNQARRER